MKKRTRLMNMLDLSATLVTLVLVIVAFVLFLTFFNALEIPTDITLPAPEIPYVVLGFELTTSSMNLIIGSLIAYLLVFVPLTFQGIKRVLNREDVEMEHWNYRHQYLLAFFDLMTLNIISATIRFILAQKISNLVVNYGFIESVKRTGIIIGQSFVKVGLGFAFLYKKVTNLFLKDEKKYTFASTGSKTQDDIEKLNRGAFLSKIIRLSLTYTFLTLMAIFIFIPFYWMFVTSLKDNYTLVNELNPSFFIDPADMQWSNFRYILTVLDFGQYMWNTIFVGLVTMSGTVIITILSAFAFSRLEWKGREFIFSILLMTMMIPGELYTITNYVTVSSLGWVKNDNSFLALIIPFMTSVFYIFFLRQAFRQIPDTLYRAAKVDGCTDFKFLTRVMLPIASPTIITIIILSAMGAWDAYIWPQLVTNESHWLISVALRSANFTSGSGSDARPLANLQIGAAALVTVPLLIIFFSLKKYIVSGVGRSGTKG